MGELHGKEATIKTGAGASTVTLMQEWKIDVTLEAEDITDFGDDWKAVAAGLADWKGSMTGLYDPSDTTGQKALQDLIVAASPTGASTNTKFYIDGTHYFSGNIIITGLSVSVTVTGIIKVTITFQGNGAMSYT